MGDGITCIDTGYTRPRMTACYLLEDSGHAAFIDTGVNHNVDGLLALLADKDIPYESVDYIIPTHVHLDHAGGAGRLIEALPNAQLVIHPFGARHMIDPAKLVNGAKVVYGEDEFQALYGELAPVPRQRVIEAPDKFSLSLGQRELLFLDTPGHASHHFCIYDKYAEAIFSGDTFGLSYREFDTNSHVFSLPTTTPVQFKPDKLHESIDRLLALNPKRILLTHFGEIMDVESAAEQLHADIDALTNIASRHFSAGHEDMTALEMAIETELHHYYLDRVRELQLRIASEEVRRLLAVDLRLNAQGLAIWASRQP